MLQCAQRHRHVQWLWCNHSMRWHVQGLSWMSYQHARARGQWERAPLLKPKPRRRHPASQPANRPAQQTTPSRVRLCWGGHDHYANARSACPCPWLTAMEAGRQSKCAESERLASLGWLALAVKLHATGNTCTWLCGAQQAKGAKKFGQLILVT